MSAHTIDLKPKVEKSLAELASQRNISLEEYMVQVLEGAVMDLPSSNANDKSSTAPLSGTMSGTEMIDYWRSVGALNRQDMTEDSVEYVQRTRRAAELRKSS